MKHDSSYGNRVLFFVGESYNSASGDEDVTANLRIDKLNLDFTDSSTNTDQKQSVNLFNYKVTGTEYHSTSYDAKSCVYTKAGVSAGGDAETSYLFNMVAMINEDSPEIHFFTGLVEITDNT